MTLERTISSLCGNIRLIDVLFFFSLTRLQCQVETHLISRDFDSLMNRVLGSYLSSVGITSSNLKIFFYHHRIDRVDRY